MFKKQRQAKQQLRLYYRIYILYFETNPSTLKNINRKAFYRVSVWQKDEELADMSEGLNPTILADKIFLPNACLNFNNVTTQPQLNLHLWYRHKADDSVLAQADFDLSHFNKRFRQKSEKQFVRQNLLFPLGNDSLTLVFNLFIETGKIELDTNVRKFIEE